MTSTPGPPTWAMQQLAGFLAAILGDADRDGMLAGACHRMAEAVDAEVCAIVAAEVVVAAVGYPAADRDDAALLAVADGARQELVVPGLGSVPATRVELSLDLARCIVIGRSGEAPGADERHLLRAMGQVLELALELRGSVDRERALREATELQARELHDVNGQLVEALAIKRDLIAMASHELRTPLTALIGFTELLRSRWRRVEEAERDRYLGIVERHGHRLLRLVNDLLTVGQMETGRVAPAPTLIRLSATVRDILDSNAQADVPVIGAEDDEVEIDLDHLARMVLNLVENARKYGAPPIEVHVRPGEGEVAMVVVDHGPGVPEGFIPAMFDRFTQASTGDTREGTGVGLGLSIVAGLAEQNGIDLAYGHADGRTSFTLHLPRPVTAGATPLP